MTLFIFRQQSSLGKIGKEEPWTLDISYWSDKLSTILDYFTFDPKKKYFTNSAQKSGAICLSRPRIPARLRVPKFSRPRVLKSHVPTSPHPTSHVPVPLLATATTDNYRIDDRMSRNGNQVTEIGIRLKQIDKMKQIQNQLALQRQRSLYLFF